MNKAKQVLKGLGVSLALVYSAAVIRDITESPETRIEDMREATQQNKAPSDKEIFLDTLSGDFQFPVH